MDFKLYYVARRNPAIRVEDWPETWRSHFRYVSQFPMIAPNVKALHYCARIRSPGAPGSDGAPALPGAKHDYDGVGIVAPRPDVLKVSYPQDVRDKIDVDERRVFDALVRTFSF